jgi:SAM-dependent methyltransferase
MVDIQGICSGLHLGDDGIWYANKKADTSYPAYGNEDCFEIEDRSFWFRHRNECIASLIRAYPPVDRGPIFDIGGANGYVSRGISANGFDVVLVEPSIDGVRNAKKRGVGQIICAALEDAQFVPRSLHGVGLFDVIEHIQDDASFLKSIDSLLIGGGRLYITVPAYSFLWSNEDVFAGHYRRYTIKALSEKLNQAGFSVDFSTYIFRFLPLPIFFFRTIPSRIGLAKERTSRASVSRDHATNNSLLGRFINAVLSSEIRNIQRNSPMGFGGSCLLVATRP